MACKSRNGRLRWNLDLWRFPFASEISMTRNFIQPVAVLLLALHGVIAISGSAGLHAISGCYHCHDDISCSHDHAIADCDRHSCPHETDHATSSFVRNAFCLTDSHGCPICQWWYSNGQSVVTTCDVICIGTQPLTGAVGDIDILLPRPDHRESFPRGPPSVLPLA